MKILSDLEIVKWVRGYKGHPGIFEGLWIPSPPTGKYSPIQPCSVDLSIGGIFLPDVSAEEDGSVGKPKKVHELGPGETAVVTTREKVQFPSLLGGICFPPASISSKGLLMTNPGHIDPGLSGFLTFTLINMSKESYLLEKNKPIVSCLIFLLEAPPEMDYAAQGHEPVLVAPTRELLRKLSRSFLNIEERAQKAAEKDIKQRIDKFSTGAFVGFMLTVLGFYISALTPLGDLRDRVSVLEGTVSIRSLEQRLGVLSDRLSRVEASSIAEEPSDGD